MTEHDRRSGVRWRRYPLSKRLLVEASSSRDARRVRLLTGASDRRRDLLDRIGGGLIAVAGPRPWGGGHWAWPLMSPAEVERSIGDLVDGVRLVGAALPRQQGRERLSLLARAGTRDVVIKLGSPGDGLEDEAAALDLLTHRPLPGIATPAVLATGTIGEGAVAVLATDALGLSGQRPAIGVDLSRFEGDVTESLRDLPRPDGTAPDAVVVHGDLAPWNLRHTERGLALFDWEAVGWGHPGTDLEHYRAACATLTR